MKTNTIERTTETNVTESSAFKYKASGKAFKVLFDGLYSDKIQSIIRELGSNATDSHIAAGCPDKPWKMKLPSTFDLTFSVKDEGLGLSHEDVMNLYVTVFESTKEETNDMVGSFGLGSKTPFSYTDTFSVVSIFEGTRSMYSALMNSRGEPDIHFLGSLPTSEHNGVEVSFSVSPRDCKKFEEAANLVVLGFDVKPLVTNRENHVWPEINVTQEGKGYRVYKPESKYNTRFIHGCYAKMGCVLYPIDSSLIDNQYRTILQNNFIIDFPIGSLGVTASRESLSYSDRDPTKKSIEDTLETIVKNLQDDFRESTAQCKTEREAYVKLRDQSEIPYNMRLREVYWQGIKIGPHNRTFGLSIKSSWFTKKFEGGSTVNNSYTINKVIVENTRQGERDVRGPSRVLKYQETISDNAIWVRLSNSDNPKEENEELIRLIEYLGDVEVVLVKDLPDITVNRTAGKVSVKYLDSYLRDTWSVVVELSEQEMKDGGYYLKYYKNEPEADMFYGKSSYSNQILELMKSVGLLPTDFKILKVPKPLWKRFEGSQWKEVGEVLSQWVEKTKDKWEKAILEEDLPRCASDLWGQIPILVQSKLKLSKYTHEEIQLMNKFHNRRLPESFDKLQEMCYDKYPLLKVYDRGYKDLFVDYIKERNTK